MYDLWLERWDVDRMVLRFVEDLEVRRVEVIRLVKKLWRKNLLVMHLHVKNENVE
jgi:hypothetical protein